MLARRFSSLLEERSAGLEWYVSIQEQNFQFMHNILYPGHVLLSHDRSCMDA